ncbi:aldehyde dehydrogenase [Mycobacterium colombiense]
MLTYDKLFIGGRWRSPQTDALIDVISPHTTEVVGRVPQAAPSDVDAAVAAARRAFDRGDWPGTPVAQRSACVARFAELYAARLDEMAELITTEMGCPINFSRLIQAPAPWMILSNFIGVAEAYPWEEMRPGPMGETIVRSEAVGVVGIITPWNVPQTVLMSKLAPALLAGCAVVVKPAPESPLNAMLMAELLAEAGIPEGVVSVLPGGPQVGEYLVTHPGVDKVAFTGSTPVGRRIGALCGERLKRVSLELGGKSAAIILDDADLDAAVEGLKFASLMNSGQACIAQTRILTSRQRYGDVVEALSAAVGAMRVGDPMDQATEIGPLVSEKQLRRVENYIAVGLEEGAKITVGGGGRPDPRMRGWYVRPTVFADVSNDMRIARDEIFGPVLCVIPYRDEEDAVRLANDSEYGLSGSVWTNDLEAGMRVARLVRTGMMSVNGAIHDLSAPAGGYKASGIGREFGREGLGAYVELKSIARPAA